MSKPVPVLLGLLIALLAGGAAGYVIGAQGQGTPPATAAPDSAKTPAPQPSPQAPEQAPPANSPDAAAPAGLAGWLATLADEKPVPGTGRIHGRVATADGDPVAGATITASVQHPDDAPQVSADKPLAETVEAMARRANFLRSGILAALTDADGRYAFSELGNYEFALSATAAGYACTRMGGARVRPDAEVNFRAAPVCVLELDVRMPDGSPPAKANASLAVGNSSHGFSWTPSSRTHKAEPGKAVLTVTAGEHRQYVAEPQTLDFVPGTPLKVTVQLRAAPGILCRLEMPPSLKKLRSLSVSLVPNPAPEAPVRRSYGVARENKSLFEGNSVAFTGLTAGRYRLIAFSTTKLLAWTDVDLGDEFREVTLAVPEPDQKDYIVVRVKTPEGEPAKGVQFSLSMRGEGFDEHGTVTTLWRDDGSTWILRQAPESRRAADGRPFSYVITATSARHGIIEASYPSDATHELVIQYQAPAMLTIHVPGAAVHPSRGRIRPLLWRVKTEGNRTSMTHEHRALKSQALESDTLKCEPLSPGKYRFSLQLAAPTGRPGISDSDEVAHWDFDLLPGENAQTCPIPAFYKLTVVIADPSSVRELSVRSTDGRMGRGRYHDAIEARMVFDGLTAGEWVIATDEGEMLVNLARDIEVNLETRKYDCVVLGGIKAGGKLEAAGLRDGDKVIRIDGQATSGGRAATSAMFLSLSKESTTWTVLRAGTEVDITFNGKELMKVLEGGGEDRFFPQPGFRD